jgi:diguanylate cyclase (GGDEF)-like protein
MLSRKFDLSARGWSRVVVLTVLGTLCCIALAMFIDCYNFETGEWLLHERWLNNVVIPALIAPPFFFFLLSKLRELAIAHDDLMIVASTDPLTQCLNRRAFTALIDGYMERITNQADKQGALLIIDVDNFKAVNDSFGHDLGDAALKVIAQAIKGSVREIDLVGRMGGEEFGVFLPGLSAARTATVAERIRRAVSLTKFLPLGRKCDLSISVGGTTFDTGTSFSELYRRADQRLYAAKRNGRNRVDIDSLPPPGLRASAAMH